MTYKYDDCECGASVLNRLSRKMLKARCRLAPELLEGEPPALRHSLQRWLERK